MSKFEKLLELYSNTTVERHELNKAKEAMTSTQWQADSTATKSGSSTWLTKEQGLECIDAAILSCDLYLLDLEHALETKDFNILE